MDQTLCDRRGVLEASWRAGVAEHRQSARGRPEVLSSWQRSSATVQPGIDAAPVATPDDIARRWSASRLGRASRVILDDLTDLASDGDMMAALTDESVTIAWITGGRTMRRRADRVHFSLGGCWAEDAVGTNALALAERSGRAATVFSAEHYAPMVHDWVCYSAPIMDPVTGTFLGVLDLSAMWHAAHPTLLTTVSALTRCVEYELARDPTSAVVVVSPESRGDRVLGVLGCAAVAVYG
jgi:transcriptional regulator of acetoin/glycerol metabolism